jgi:hypothetical protein
MHISRSFLKKIPKSSQPVIRFLHGRNNRPLTAIHSTTALPAMSRKPPMYAFTREPPWGDPRRLSLGRAMSAFGRIRDFQIETFIGEFPGPNAPPRNLAMRTSPKTDPGDNIGGDILLPNRRPSRRFCEFNATTHAWRIIGPVSRRPWDGAAGSTRCAAVPPGSRDYQERWRCCPTRKPAFRRPAPVILSGHRSERSRPARDGARS